MNVERATTFRKVRRNIILNRLLGGNLYFLQPNSALTFMFLSHPPYNTYTLINLLTVSFSKVAIVWYRGQHLRQGAVVWGAARIPNWLYSPQGERCVGGETRDKRERKWYFIRVRCVLCTVYLCAVVWCVFCAIANTKRRFLNSYFLKGNYQAEPPEWHQVR